MKKSTDIIKEVLKKHRLRRYFLLLIGLLLTAFAFNLFLLPNNIDFGGISGLSIIVTKFFPIEPSLFILIVSLLLLIVSYFLLGKEKTKASVLGSLLFPLFVELTSRLDTVFHIGAEDPLLLAIFGGVIYGFGVGLVFKAGFTTGGTDILNQIISKYFHVSIGSSMLMVDGLIVLGGAFVFGWAEFMYGVLVLYIISVLTDKVLLGISNSKAFYIITSKTEEVTRFVIDELNHSVTMLDAVGAYKNTKNAVLFTVIPTKEYYKLKEGISYIDPNAFFTVIDAYEVLGGE